MERTRRGPRWLPWFSLWFGGSLRPCERTLRPDTASANEPDAEPKVCFEGGRLALGLVKRDFQCAESQGGRHNVAGGRAGSREKKRPPNGRPMREDGSLFSIGGAARVRGPQAAEAAGPEEAATESTRNNNNNRKGEDMGKCAKTLRTSRSPGGWPHDDGACVVRASGAGAA